MCSYPFYLWDFSIDLNTSFFFCSSSTRRMMNTPHYIGRPIKSPFVRFFFLRPRRLQLGFFFGIPLSSPLLILQMADSNPGGWITQFVSSWNPCKNIDTLPWKGCTIDLHVTGCQTLSNLKKAEQVFCVFMVDTCSLIDHPSPDLR